VPLGLVIAVIGVGALLLAVRLLAGDRWNALACGMGVMLTTLVFSGQGPGGSIVVPAPADGQLSTGIVWTIAVPLLAALIVGWPGFTRPAASSARLRVGRDDRRGQHELDSRVTYVIALPCVDVKDRACIDECPVDCIYEGALALHPPRRVRRLRRVRAGLPVEAIYYEDDLPTSGRTTTPPTSSSSTTSARRAAPPRSA
jgi:hypothetical protein